MSYGEKYVFNPVKGNIRFWKDSKMDYENDNRPSQFGSQEPEKNTGESQAKKTTKSTKGKGWKVLFGIILGLSVLANIILFLMIIGLGFAFIVGRQTMLTEQVIREGPYDKKIAVVNIEGVINPEQSEHFHKQLKKARKDKSVKGIILRVNSPGGTIADSDRIYNQIRNETDKPVVAFMAGMAASGGYYTSVACDKIIAEPTTITGSIGVIAGWFVVKDLLQQKLGIQPVIVKSGEKKDWPSAFRKPSDEEINYLEEKLLNPAYERFLDVVTEGRSDVLSREKIKDLANGSIYPAQEAVENKLIDATGYLDKAIDEVKALADIKKARVVKYKKPFSLSEFLNTMGMGVRFDKNLLYELNTPQAMYLWTGR